MSGKLGLWLTLTLLFLQVSSSELNNDNPNKFLMESKNQEPIVLEDQMIKNLDELPTESRNEELILRENQIIKNPDERQTESRNEEPIVRENQIIKNPYERPIESSFQKKRWGQCWSLFSVVFNQQKFTKPIVQIIISYLDVFVPINMRLPAHEEGLRKNVMSHDGRWLLSTDYRWLPYIHLTDLTSGTRVRTFTAPNQSSVFSCALAHSHLFIAGGTRAGNIYLWNTNSGGVVTTLRGHKTIVDCLCVFLNDTRIVSGSDDHTVRIWSIEHTPGICLHVLGGHTKPIITCYVSADDSQILSSSFDNTVRVWDCHTLRCIRTYPCYDFQASCVLSEDNQCYAAVKSNDGRKIKLWNINTGECEQTISIGNQEYDKIFYLSADRLVFGYWNKIGVLDLTTNIQYIRSFKDRVYAYVRKFRGTGDRRYVIIVSGGEKTWMKVYRFTNINN